MKFNKNILIICSQKGSTNNLRFYFKDILKIKTNTFKIEYFNSYEINKKISFYGKKFDVLKKLVNKYEIILGSSEKKIEINISNYLIKNNLDFFFYIDSITNLKKRFKGITSLPKKIICLNKTVISELKKQIKIDKKKTNLINLNMPYQNYLKKNYSKIKKKNIFILYVSSFLGLKIEKKNIIKLLVLNKSKNILIKIHPRDNYLRWKKEFINFTNIKIYKYKEFYNEKRIKHVFGVSTMALLNYKFAGFNVRFFNDQKVKKSPFFKLLKEYKIREFKK